MSPRPTPFFQDRPVAVKAHAHLDTLVIRILLKEPRPWNWVKAKFAELWKIDVYVREDFGGEAIARKLGHDVTIQNPTRNQLLKILGSELWAQHVQVLRLDAALDFHLKQSTDKHDDDDVRRTFASFLVRHRVINRIAIQKEGGGPRLQMSGRPTLILRKRENVMIMGTEYHAVPEALPGTFYWGPREGPLCGKIYMKDTDRRVGVTFEELPNAYCCVRDEVSIAGDHLLGAGIEGLSDIIDPKHGKFCALFKYATPVVRSPHEAVRLIAQRRFDTGGLWAFCEKWWLPPSHRRGVRQRLSRAHPVLNRHSFDAWRRFGQTWGRG